MRILISGSSGFIGSHLVVYLRKKGHEVIRLVRKKESLERDELCWDPENGIVQAELFEGFDGVLHLAGGSIAAKRWTKKRKQELFQSRCRDTWLLAHALARLKKPPAVFICASAIGFYGDRGDESLTEESTSGDGFVASLCQKWEEASSVLMGCGTRVVYARFGTVLSPDGGMLKQLLPLFRKGCGAVLGSGMQWLSWIALDDAVRALEYLLQHPELKGAVNLTAPQPVQNSEFSTALAQSYGKKVFLRLPVFLMRLIFGEVADEVLLASARVYPKKLLNAGFTFNYPTLDLILEYFAFP